jgi:large subunit ribosomal protein L23
MNKERIFQVLVGPHASEKAAIVADSSNQYVFRVAANASKLEIKRSVEKLFKVKVSSVNTLKVKGKVKRNRFGSTTKSTWKKAYVRLEQGQDIDFAVAD